MPDQPDQRESPRVDPPESDANVTSERHDTDLATPISTCRSAVSNRCLSASFRPRPLPACDLMDSSPTKKSNDFRPP